MSTEARRKKSGSRGPADLLDPASALGGDEPAVDVLPEEMVTVSCDDGADEGEDDEEIGLQGGVSSTAVAIRGRLLGGFDIMRSSGSIQRDVLRTLTGIITIRQVVHGDVRLVADRMKWREV